jgi:hypothetical protein
MTNLKAKPSSDTLRNFGRHIHLHNLSRASMGGEMQFYKLDVLQALTAMHYMTNLPN